MKDWKFLQVGNTKTGNYESSTQRPDSKIYQTIHEFIKTSGGDADKAFVAIKRKYPNLTDEFIEKSIDEVIRTNKAGNESIDKQEWSLYQGLKKDAEKEIGNSTWRMRHGTIAEVKDDGTVIYSKNGMTSKEKFETKEKAEEHLKFIGSTKVENSDKEIGNADTDAKFAELYKSQEWEKLSSPQQKKIQLMAWLRQGKITSDEFAREARKIGNADTVSEYNAEIQRLTKKAEQLRRMGQGRSAMEIEKQIEKLGKEMRELGNSKTGNTAHSDKVEVIKKLIAGGWSVEDIYKMLKTEGYEVEKSFIERLKTGNAQYGSKEDIISHLDTDLYEIHQRLKQKDESPWRYLSELQKKGYDMGTLSRHNKDIGKIIEKLKTGNGTPGSIASIGPAWMHGGTVYGKMDTDESGKRHNEYVKITWLGEGKGGVANYFIDDRMQSDKLGSLDKNELKRWAEQKIGNEETKAERKFGKVMGEFEEGALKTPQGKTVTDPAQAKAIAYSEADKVDNLKRARNAMNKKCGNAQITLWKGNDTVLISEDGTVQYLESNSFEVDRAKYDSQQKAIEEMTKEGYRKK